jgi:hypothetical protein
MYNFKEKRKIITTVLLSIGLIVGGLFHSSCFEEETVTPLSRKYCIIKLVIYHPKPDGTTKPSEPTMGYTTSDSQGKCPSPAIEWKSQ